MKISIMVEGKTEKAFMPHLRCFLQARLAGNMPKLDPVPYDGRIPKGDKLKRCVENLLSSGQRPADAVIALTDVYTGTDDFTNANDARTKMQSWVRNERFYPHAAQHDFEAWLLPYWPKSRSLRAAIAHNRTANRNPSTTVNLLRTGSTKFFSTAVGRGM